MNFTPLLTKPSFGSCTKTNPSSVTKSSDEAPVVGTVRVFLDGFCGGDGDSAGGVVSPPNRRALMAVVVRFKEPVRAMPGFDSVVGEALGEKDFFFFSIRSLSSDPATGGVINDPVFKS